MAVWKYVVVKTGPREWPVIFPPHMIHVLMAESAIDYVMREVILERPDLTPEMYQSIRDNIKVVSAGDVVVSFEATHGKSESLRIQARESDYRMFSGIQYTHGITEEDNDDN